MPPIETDLRSPAHLRPSSTEPRSGSGDAQANFCRQGGRDPLQSRWSQLARLDDSEAHEVWEWFVQSYAGFVRDLLRLHRVADLDSATAEFWGYLFERRQGVASADRSRRFRAFLTGFVRNFVRERRRSGTAASALPADLHEPSPVELEEAETRLWADALLQISLDQVERSKKHRGTVLRLFYGIPARADAARAPQAVSAVAKSLGLAASTISPMLTEARRLLRQAIERNLRDTVASRADWSDEIETLYEALRHPHPGLCAGESPHRGAAM